MKRSSLCVAFALLAMVAALPALLLGMHMVTYLHIPFGFFGVPGAVCILVACGFMHKAETLVSTLN